MMSFEISRVQSFCIESTLILNINPQAQLKLDVVKETQERKIRNKKIKNNFSFTYDAIIQQLIDRYYACSDVINTRTQVLHTFKFSWEIGFHSFFLHFKGSKVKT
ncbi:CLUMA_CG021568, isoform A [Clunio marinus]|uniref:CLUMA_CG021568, isoform A n=1 Tax=Clunio marinus TaxID=568069 RepID=A0A1J1J9I1_9DIPT|nr:CLUMA_CG021568, isoform A [Clunio marinus]